MSSNQGSTSDEEPLEPLALAAGSAQFAMRYLRFGDFQLDLHREKLWKKGERVRLQGKVYQTLLILLSRAGNVVTREEVRRHLWPGNQNVNVDANLNTSMNKLRQTLDDSPESPVYIETIPRKGYCFLMKVEQFDTLQPISASAVISDGDRVAERSGVIATSQEQPRDVAALYSLPIGLRIATLLLAGIIVGALIALAWFSCIRTHRALNESVVSGPQVSVFTARFGTPS